MHGATIKINYDIIFTFVETLQVALSHLSPLTNAHLSPLHACYMPSSAHFYFVMPAIFGKN